MKGFLNDLKKESKWVIAREIFFIVLFVITVIGFCIKGFASEVNKVDEVEQLTAKQLYIKGSLKGNEVVERGPRYLAYPTALGIVVTQNGYLNIDLEFTQNVGEILLDVYDMNDNCIMQMIAFTGFQTKFKLDMRLLEPGVYWLQTKNTKGGTGLTQFEKL